MRKAVGYILALGGLGVAGYGAYRWLRQAPPPPPPPPPDEDENGIVKVSALTFVAPWPPQVGVPMNVMSYRPEPERGFKNRVGKYTMNIYEVPYSEYISFPRSPKPGDGPDTFYYDKLPWEWYSDYKEFVRHEVTEDMVELRGMTPRVSGKVIVFDVAWWVRRTIWPIPIWDWYACTGYGRIL